MNVTPHQFKCNFAITKAQRETASTSSTPSIHPSIHPLDASFDSVVDEPRFNL